MKTIRTVLSVIALLAAALGVAAASGMIHWNVALVDLVMAGGTMLGTFGVAPFALTVVESRICAGVATFTSAIVAAHAAGTIPGAPKIFNVIAVGAALLSILGRWDDPNPTPVPPAPTPPAPVPPKAA